MTGNIFDLSALPSARANQEPNPAEYLNEPSGNQFEYMLNGAISDGSQVRSDSPEKPEQFVDHGEQTNQKMSVSQEKQENLQERPATKIADESKPTDKPVQSTDKNTKVDGEGLKSKVGEKNQIQSAGTRPVLTKSGEERTNNLVRKLAMVSKSDLINKKTSIKPGLINTKSGNVVKSATNNEAVASLTATDKINQPTSTLDKFTVEKVTVKGDEVEIIAKPTNDKTRTVKIVVSKDQFEGLMSPKKVSNEPLGSVIGKNSERIELDGTAKAAPKLNELLDKLNLQEIQVKSEITQNAKVNSPRPISQETTVKLVGADSSAEMLVKGKLQFTNEKAGTKSKKRLAPKGIDLTSPQSSKAAASQNSATAGDGRVSLVNMRSSDGGMILKEIKVRPEVMNLADQFSGETKMTEAGFDKNFSSVMSTESSQTGSASRSELPQVKFSLPDDINQSLKPGGKSVMIKINPEILGPVRLSVRMQNGQLQARLLVDNVQIKSMIESSLDQLTNQLERAGIKVDQLEVNVAGSDVGSELFDRSIAQHRPKIGTRILNAEEAEVLSVSAETISRSSGEYVSPSGVNLFA